MKTRLHASTLVALALVMSASAAQAIITQPNGLVVPRDSMNGEVQLYQLFTSRGETGLDWQADGNRTPATFSPLCDFRATLVLRQTASSLAVGWYNVRPGTTPPALSEIYTIVPAGSPVGVAVTGANIRSNPNYLGGEIGFALIRTSGGFNGVTYTTQAELNPTCSACTTPGPWVMSLIYPSRAIANAFYVTFEDGNVGDNNASFQNDGDYNDYVFLFEGLQCTGGGARCDTGMMGVCSAGLTRCGGMGCAQSTMPSPERCDGQDNNCNGTTDEGADLCAAGMVCDRGRCVPPCVEGACFDTQRCINGLCVEATCVGVLCTAGQRCIDGTCRGACDAVICPAGQTCRAGACVDPCAGVACPAGQACNGGVCRTSCVCSSCASGESCNASSGLCVDTRCVGVDCSSMANTVCRMGACVDRCAGAVCPAGQACTAGSCVDVPPARPEPAPEAGVRDAAAAVDASFDAGAAMDAASADGAVPMDSGSLTRDASMPPPVGASGCGCAVPTSSSRASSAWLLGALSLAFIARRNGRGARRTSARDGER